MLDLHVEMDRLKVRVAALEARTVSGMPDTSIAERFGVLHDRVDIVGRNVLKALDLRFKELDSRISDTRAEMKQGFEHVNGRLDLIDLRFEQVDGRFEKIDQRFETIDQRFDVIDQRFETIDQRFDVIDQRFETIDQRFDVIDQRFETIDQRFETIDQRFGRVEQDIAHLKGAVTGLTGDMTDIKAMLVSLGAKAPERA
ncbi:MULTISPECIES: hypothetical protein [unclassified Nonomuraea]|uniref:hypothetical protein n=1 Tax=unclassified Nonomuraea TaxID=2593643 RepID=UPI0033F5195E